MCDRHHSIYVSFPLPVLRINISAFFVSLPSGLFAICFSGWWEEEHFNPTCQTRTPCKAGWARCHQRVTAVCQACTWPRRLCWLRCVTLVTLMCCVGAFCRARSPLTRGWASLIRRQASELGNRSRGGDRSGCNADHLPLPAPGGGTSFPCFLFLMINREDRHSVWFLKKKNHQQLNLTERSSEQMIDHNQSQNQSRMMCCTAQHIQWKAAH